uniref:Uncharacterized protein n=1 Tax=Oryza rufipogon TaxID=4529 RepID=A0A0E0RBN3_ORYRU
MADVALGAVSMVLGLIRNEARLLGGARDDVQFIMDEMESMNDLLRHLVAADRRAGGDYYFRTWMKQVMELAFDSRSCVELYMQQKKSNGHGLLGRLRGASWLPWAIAQHRVVTRIRELKARACEISERQARYMKAAAIQQPSPGAGVVVAAAGHRRRSSGRTTDSSRSEYRRIILDGDAATVCASEIIRCLDSLEQESNDQSDNTTPPPPTPPPRWLRVAGEIIRWLYPPKQSSGNIDVRLPGLRVLAVTVHDGADASAVVDKVCEDIKQSISSSSDEQQFDCVLRVSVERPPILLQILLVMLGQILPARTTTTTTTTSNSSFLEYTDEGDVRKKLADSLKGKRLLLLLSDLDYHNIWVQIQQLLASSGCSNGSTVVFSTNDTAMAEKCSPDKHIHYSPVDIYFKKAEKLLPSKLNNDDSRLKGVVREILGKCILDVQCLNMFLHALYCNPDITEQELEQLDKSLGLGQEQRDDLMIAFCYQSLPTDYKNCLWYSTVFTHEAGKVSGVRRASLVRRWVAQGLVKQNEADHCFHTINVQNLMVHHKICSTGKVKSCAVHPLVADTINKESPTVEDLLLNNQLPLDDLDLLFSIRNGIQLHRCNYNIVEFLKSLSSSPRLMLTVLDLEGRKGLKKKDLDMICKIRTLKYLNLRNTDVTQLPKQIGQLENLETLDIRGTREQEFHAVLPQLKHLLAGCIDCPTKDAVKSEESFSTVCMPRGVATMENLEILSRVKVSDSAKELVDIGDKLGQLKKLGVVLSGEKATLKDLFIQVDKLHRKLQSLSIRMETSGSWDAIDAILLRPPRLLESLHICNITSRLPPRIKELHQLAKITLRDTFLKEDALNILGTLRGLRSLRLRYHSFAEGALTFRSGQFNNLTDLEIRDNVLISITFAPGTALKLNKMVWCFTEMEMLSGVQNLMKLTHLELNGGICLEDGLKALEKDIAPYRSRISLKLNPPENDERSGVIAASS